MTTTIEITDDQKQALDELKEYDREPYKDVVQSLIDAYSNDSRIPNAAELSIPSSVDGSPDSDNLAREVAAKIDYAELATHTADELEGRMR